MLSLWSGGHTRNIFQLAKALRKLGHNIEFFVHRISDPEIDDTGFVIHKSGLPKYNILSFSRAAEQFVRYNSNQFDVIHCNGGSSYSVMGIPLGKRPPAVLHLRAANYRNSLAIFHDDLLRYYPRYLKQGIGAYFEWYFDKISISGADHVFCNSRETLEAVALKVGMRNKMSVLHNGMESLNIPYNEDSTTDLTVGYFARFFLQKGWLYFFAIAKEILRINPKMKILIAGKGELEWFVKKQIRSLSIENNFTFVGGIDSEAKKQEFFRNISLFLCPTAPGTTSLEALSYGVPVLVAKRSKDVTDGLDLEFFVNTGDVRQLIDATPLQVATENFQFHEELQNRGNVSNDVNEIEREYLWGAIARKCAAKYEYIINVKN